eukprot:250703_1
MAEQIVTPSQDQQTAWFDLAKQKIQNKEQAKALQRINELKHLIIKSVNDTLVELKLHKYDGNITYFKLSSDEVIQRLGNEWNVSKLHEWEAPAICEGMQSNDYVTQCIKQYGDQYGPCDVISNPIFWEFILNEVCVYCAAIASEIFGNSSDIQLSNTLHTCLGVCGLLDILKRKLLSKQTLINNIRLQSIINQQFGTKIDIEKSKQTHDIKKVYKQCALSIQKEAMKSGKAFMKLYKVYKIQRHKEKKRKANKSKKQIETDDDKLKATPPTVDSTPTEQEKEEEKTKEEEIVYNAEVESKDKSSNTNLFVLASIIAFCLVILAVV